METDMIMSIYKRYMNFDTSFDKNIFLSETFLFGVRQYVFSGPAGIQNSNPLDWGYNAFHQLSYYTQMNYF